MLRTELRRRVAKRGGVTDVHRIDRDGMGGKARGERREGVATTGNETEHRATPEIFLG